MPSSSNRRSTPQQQNKAELDDTCFTSELLAFQLASHCKSWHRGCRARSRHLAPSRQLCLNLTASCLLHLKTRNVPAASQIGQQEDEVKCPDPMPRCVGRKSTLGHDFVGEGIRGGAEAANTKELKKLVEAGKSQALRDKLCCVPALYAREEELAIVLGRRTGFGKSIAGSRSQRTR